MEGEMIHRAPAFYRDGTVIRPRNQHDTIGVIDEIVCHTGAVVTHDGNVIVN